MMARQVTATITFILHEDLDDGVEADIPDYLIDCLENERVGAAQYKSVKIDALTVVKVEDE